MKASAILISLFSASALATTIPLATRQEAPAQNVTRQPVLLPQNVQALNEARQDAADAIKRGQGRGRLLKDEASCNEACKRCRGGATAKAVFEVFSCGTAAVAIDVLTDGALFFLDAAGFISCEVAVVAALNEAEETCTKA